MCGRAVGPKNRGRPEAQLRGTWSARGWCPTRSDHRRLRDGDCLPVSICMIARHQESGTLAATPSSSSPHYMNSSITSSSSLPPLSLSPTRVCPAAATVTAAGAGWGRRRPGSHLRGRGSRGRRRSHRSGGAEPRRGRGGAGSRWGGCGGPAGARLRQPSREGAGAADASSRERRRVCAVVRASRCGGSGVEVGLARPARAQPSRAGAATAGASSRERRMVRGGNSFGRAGAVTRRR